MTEPRSVRGAELLRDALGRRLVGVKRWVFDLGGANDEHGHGATELSFDGEVTLTLAPGPNEDFIVVHRGPWRDRGPAAASFTPVQIPDLEAWTGRAAVVTAIDLLTDGVEDVGVRFRFGNEAAFLIALVDTDLVMAEDDGVFAIDPEVSPSLRETLA